MSPRPWEAGLVQAAVDTGLVRLLARCYNPVDLPIVDAVVAGSEVPWLTVDGIRRWRRAGIAVVGMFPLGDRPAIEMFCRAEVDQLFCDRADPLVILRAVRDLVSPRLPTERGSLNRGRTAGTHR
ncbi:MAG: hypothetical protein GY720_11940 [bacterium]|nr:hypothetical protein [bacterium]